MICDKMGKATPEELEVYMEDLGTIQDMLTMHDFYMIDARSGGSGARPGPCGYRPGQGYSGLKRRAAHQGSAWQLLWRNPISLLLDEPTNYLDAEHIKWLETVSETIMKTPLS